MAERRVIERSVNKVRQGAAIRASMRTDEPDGRRAGRRCPASPRAAPHAFLDQLPEVDDERAGLVEERREALRVACRAGARSPPLGGSFSPASARRSRAPRATVLQHEAVDVHAGRQVEHYASV